MTLVEQVILDTGGRIVASFTIDTFDGKPTPWRKAHACSGCGAEDHDIKRCNGPGMEPKPRAARR